MQLVASHMHQPYTHTGVRCTLGDSAPMVCVFNGCLMVPVSSGNYKFRESVSLAGASRMHLSSRDDRCMRNSRDATIRDAMIVRWSN